ncbi:hypothetical protein SSBR45G_38370 [Bradyrhizobium sp. SSBR45G]|uniref:TIGR03809 family protein n=1 Tax=unclassified Bradyrhizobium TaxID=2631580 RepID=UPI0023429449|nr:MULTISPECIES: TIGR03809 family protein [unclassified Bradyrhizobium]GLH78928.1 hypothetical protein SSBR45G_38370 [Bradyrhizobium sp. SSBR45G]GLH85251.1 hypothetical protein SSBR45R_27110 [Bradyrhizobium sp. SSBR45R]
MACSRELAARWCALAEKRLDHLTELFDSGRWRRYYTEQSLLDDIRHAKAAVQTWKALAVGETEQVSIVPSQAPPAVVAAPPAPVRLAAPEPITYRPITRDTADDRPFEHRPIELPRSLETILAESEIVVAAELEPAVDDLEPNDVIEPDYVLEDDVVSEDRYEPELSLASPRIDMAALEQALSIGIASDADHDEPMIDLDAIERRYPALAVAY